MRYTEKLIQTNDRETGRENDRAETELNHSKLGIPGCLYVSHEAKNKLKKRFRQPTAALTSVYSISASS